MTRLLRLGYKFNLFLLGFTFFSAGMGKLFANHNYIGFIGPVWLAERLTEHNLALFGHFVGLSQVIIGFGLLTWRFRKLASIMLIPMIANILVVTISQEWKGTPYVVGIFLLMNIFLIAYDSKNYLHLLGISSDITFETLSMKGSLVWIVGLFLVCSSIWISYSHLYAAWAVSLLGLIIGSYSNWMEKTS